MDYVNLGRTGLKVSRLCLGCMSRAQAALAWPLAKPGITSPIIGTTKPTHVSDALTALELKLSDEEVACRLEADYVPHKVIGFT